jgi:hypothetical protein
MRFSATTPWAGLSCVIAALGALCPAHADQPTTWSFTLETTGQDVYWTSPTAVNDTAERYDGIYQITKLVITVQYWILPPFDVDVTDQIPPDQSSGGGSFDGPPPLTIYAGDVVYPEPPDPPAVAAYVEITLDAAGYAHAAVTNVYLGDLDLPPYGTVHLKKIHLEGAVGIWPLWWGDLNCDSVRNAFDIDPFVLALTDPAAYAATYPNCLQNLADCNGDGAVDAFDIDPFVDLLTGK